MPRASVWQQTVTLIKRNFKVKLRVKQASVQEVLMPIYFVVLLAMLKIFAYKPTAYGPISSVDLVETNVLPSETFVPRQFFVASEHITRPDLSQVMNVVTSILSGSTYQIFTSENEMVEAYKNISGTFTGQNVVGIYFPNPSINQYVLRFRYDTFSESFTDFFQGNCRDNSGNATRGCVANAYLNSGFTTIQSALDMAIAKLINPSFEGVSISARTMPKDGTLSNTDAFLIIGPLYLVMALGPFLTFLLVFVVYEKEKKIKEGMKMMGLNDLAYWFSWGIVYAVSLLVMTLIMSLIGYFGQLWPRSNFFLVFLFMFIYGLSIEMLGFMLTPFFNKARTAGAVGGFLSIIMSLIFLAIQLTDDFPVGAIWAVSLLSPTAFSFVMGKVFLFEVTGEGAQFYNLAEGSDPMYIGLVMMIVDIFLYFLLTLYLDNVVPSEYGQKKSVFYCFKPSYWCRGRRGHTRFGSAHHSETSPDHHSNLDFEQVPPECIGNEAISFHGIRKVFEKKSFFGNSSKETVAVERFTLDIYKGQITALLGHNGAGKTTLFNILTGFVPATAGAATVYGYDVTVADDMEEIRKITGVCPQHDILLDYLSVIEHLEVFAGLKGYTGHEKTAEIERVLDVIDLKDQRNTFAKKLSGGQKRKLSVGIAILGDPKILILDEPTAGMDPYSRRKLWNLLRSNQEDRVTLLTTHFMDEADILADRKAILTRGKLRCVGSSLFLKNRFGVGYHLGIVSKSHDDQHAITSCIGTHIRDAELQRSIGMEHAYTLPMNEVVNFPALFTDLDKRQDELNIQSYGVSMTTLEEVFLKTGEDDDDEEEQEQNGANERFHSVGYDNKAKDDQSDAGSRAVIDLQNGLPTFDPSQSERNSETNRGEVLLQLMRRTLLINIRNPGYVIFAMILPIVLEVVGTWLYTTSGTSSDGDNPPMIDLTYQNNLNRYSDKDERTLSVLYKGLTGAANTSFVSNVPSGVLMEQSDLSDAALLQPDPQFWPHSVGLDVSTFTVTQAVCLALYNTSYTMSLPSAINLLSNSITSFLNNNTATNIVAYSKAWPQVDSITSGFNSGAFGAVLMISMAIVLPTSFAAGNPVKERELKIRTQLRVSGVRFTTYWGAFLLADYIVYFVMAIVYIICIYAFQVVGLNNVGATFALILLLIGWGMACLLTSYTGSFLFERFETVQAAWPGIVQLASIIPYIIVSTLDMTDNRDTARYINIVFLILSPYYCGFSGVYYCFRIYLVSLSTIGQVPSASSYFDWSEPMIPLSIIMVYVHVALYSFLLLVADVREHGGQVPGCGGGVQVGSELDFLMEVNEAVDEVEDDDVAKEREKVKQIGQAQSSSAEDPIVLMDSMRKEFVKRTGKSFQSCRKHDDDEEEVTTKVAVSNLSMTVYPGEVVGLLGPNGAGKTTALNVLIADIGATKGSVSVGGEVITSSLSDAFKTMGYCPQSNPLWNSITQQEHLEIYATVRGVPKERILSTVNNFMEALAITEHKDKKAKSLSGGTKRKLCFAISMLGNPQVVLLDEPSTGMDPKTKRFLWNTISTAFEGTNRGAILTTHYMEEADALCSRVGIMVLGQLRCIGSTQHLKGKFGQGYVFEVKLEHHPEDQEEGGNYEQVQPRTLELENFVRELFPSVEEPEKFGNRWTYKINKDDVTSLATIFSSLEQAKERLGIEEYSFSQSTLEQVFLRFAKEQAEKDEEEQQKVQEKKREKKLRKRK